MAAHKNELNSYRKGNKPARNVAVWMIERRGRIYDFYLPLGVAVLACLALATVLYKALNGIPL